MEGQSSHKHSYAQPPTPDLWITSLDAYGTGVVKGSFVEELHAVFLGSDGRGEVNGDHLQHSIASWNPFPHDGLQEGLAFLFLVISVQLDFQLLYQFLRFLLLEVHNGIKYLKEGGGAKITRGQSLS